MLDLNQVSIDGVSLTQPDDLTVSKVEGWYDSPAMRSAYTARPAGSGSFFAPAFQDARTLTVTGRVAAIDRASLLQRMRQINGLCLDPRSLFEFRVDDTLGTLTTQVQRSSDVAWSELNEVTQDYQVTFTAPDPRKLVLDPSSVVTLMAQPGAGGVVWNGPIGGTGTRWNGVAGITGVEYSQPTDTGTITLDNLSGNASADVLLTIQGPILNPRVSTAFGVIQYMGDLAANDKLVINTGTGSVLLNESNRRSLLSRADFFQIPPASVLNVMFSGDLENNTALLTALWYVSSV